MLTCFRRQSGSPRREVNRGDKVLPADMLGQSEEQYYNPVPRSKPASIAASVQSSINSQSSSSSRNKLQKKRTRET